MFVAIMVVMFVVVLVGMLVMLMGMLVMFVMIVVVFMVVVMVRLLLLFIRLFHPLSTTFVTELPNFLVSFSCSGDHRGKHHSYSGCFPIFLLFRSMRICS